MRRRYTLLGLAATLAAARARAQPLGRVEIGATAPDFVLTGADGRAVRLSGFGGRPVMLEWTNPVCPFTAKKYARGAMQGLQREAARRGVAWLAIDTAAPAKPGFLSPEAAQARVRAQGMRVTALLSDPTGAVGRLYGARTTPTVYLIGPDGRLAYQGAVDGDAFAEAPPAAAAYARDALQDVLARRPVRRPETRPYGCPVEY